MRRVVVACLGVLAVLLAACGGSPRFTAPPTGTLQHTVTTKTTPPDRTTFPYITTSTPASTTQMETYDPFTTSASVKATMQIIATKTATQCVGGGVAGNSSFRCFTQPDIYDPCFAPKGATSGPVYCPLSPLGDQLTKLKVGSLPGPLSGAPEYRDWAVALQGGQTCVLVNAAWGGLGPFSCQAPGPEADCHTPTEGSPWWMSDCQADETQSSPFSAFQIETVWN